MRNPFEVYTSLNNSRKNRPLDWEESALDSQGHVEGFFDEDRRPPSLFWLRGAVAACFVIIVFRLFHLQVIQGSEFRELSEDNRIRSQTLLAPRGIIRDRNGETLAENTASFNLVAIPFDLPKEGLEDEITKLSAAFELEQSEVTAQLANINRVSFEPVVIRQDLSPDQAILFETRASEFYGFQVQKIPIRQYPAAEIFSHALGYTGLISPQELAGVDRDAYDINDYIGKQGIEQQYESILHGQNGENLVEVDASGRLLDVLGENSPQPGNVLTLNIDKGLQQQLYHELTDKYPGRRAAAVALNPKNGEVLALISVPGFDSNLFAHGIKTGQYQQLLDNKDLPLFNRVIGGVYPPGSTVKPMVATAGLEEGVVDEHTIITDRGVLNVPNQFNPGITYAFRGWKAGGLGPMDVRSAIAMSSDIYFYVVSGGYPSGAPIAGLGAEKLAEYYRKFNVGSLTGIDVPGEKPGLVPDSAWKESYFKDDPILAKWYLGDTYHVGIGQGDMLVTPLQVAEWTAAIANNGTAYKPRIAARAQDQSGQTIWESKPEVLISNIASPGTLKIVQEGMRQTVVSGTARALSTLPISSAGKTGTSQFDGSDPSRTHAWFTVYAPYEDPQIVITVLVEAGGEGNAVSEPVARGALNWWVENRYNK